MAPQSAPPLPVSSNGSDNRFIEEAEAAGLGNAAVIGHLSTLLGGKAKIDEALERKGFDIDTLIAKAVELLDAKTKVISKEGAVEVEDNLTQIRSLELLADIMKTRSTDSQTLQTVKLLMEALGLKKSGGGAAVQVNYVQQLYNSYNEQQKNGN